MINYLQAAFNLGLAYESGVGCRADKEKSKCYLQIAARGGIPEAVEKMRKII